MKLACLLERQDMPPKQFLDWVVNYMHRGIDTDIVYLDVSRHLDFHSLHSDPDSLKQISPPIEQHLDIKMGNPDFWAGMTIKASKKPRRQIFVEIDADIDGEKRSGDTSIPVNAFSETEIWVVSTKINSFVGEFLDRLEDEFKDKYPDIDDSF